MQFFCVILQSRNSYESRVRVGLGWVRFRVRVRAIDSVPNCVPKAHFQSQKAETSEFWVPEANPKSQKFGLILV